MDTTETIEARILVCRAMLREMHQCLTGKSSRLGPERVGAEIWERGRDSDVALAANYCGQLTALFDLADILHLALSPRIEAMRGWATTIHPAR